MPVIYVQSPIYSVKSIEKKLHSIVSNDNIKMFFCPLSACADNCKKCSAAGKCDTCETGFIKNTAGGGSCDGQLSFVCSFSCYDKSMSN